ncbi:hypothetical protein D3C72_118440 [compost metagenome]
MSRRLTQIAAFAVLSGLLAAAPAGAQAQASVSGLLYTDFSAPTDGRAAAFNVTRAFLTGKARFNEIFSGTITYNAAPLIFVSGVNNGVGTTRTEPYDALLQSAYIQANGLVPNLNLQMGMLANPWFELESGFWGYRMLGFQYFPIFNAGYIPAFDLGLKATGNLGPLGYLAQVDNGAGFRAGENNGKKAYTAGLTAEPLPGLTLAALGYRGDNPALAQADRYAAFVGYRTPNFRVAAEATRMVTQPTNGAAVTGQILSAFTVLGLPLPLLPSPELIARVDLLDTDLSSAPVAGPADTLQGLVGFSMKPTPGVTLVLSDQVAQETSAGVTSTRNTLALHTQVAF